MTNYKRYNNMFLDCHWLIPVQLIPIFFQNCTRNTNIIFLKISKRPTLVLLLLRNKINELNIDN